MAAVKVRVEDARQRLERQRPDNRFVDAAFTSVQLQNESGGGLLAGAIAFRFFLFLVPCVFVFVTGLGIGADLSNADVQEVARSAGIAGVAATAIQSSASSSDVTRWITFVVAFFALVWGARNLLKALWLAHALIWKVPLRRVRHATVGGLALIALFGLASFTLRFVHGVRSISLIFWLVGLALYTLIPAGVWLVCSFKLFPTPPGVTWRHLWPGSIMFGFGVEVLQLVTVLWVARSIESKSQAYGAIAVALGILFWAYLLGRLVTSAAALNAALWRRTHSTVFTRAG